MAKVRNTRVEMDDPNAVRDFLMMSMAVGGGNAIEMQEKHGQSEVVQSSQLPTRGLNDPAFSMIRVIGPTDGDPMFSDVVLPEGWTKKATDHSMWSDLRDEKGRKRAGIFYKAAFYDRSAHISPDRRYYVGKDYDYRDGSRCDGSRFHVKDNATGDVLFVTDATPDPFPQNGSISREESFRRSGMEEPNKAAALAWAIEHFPDFQNAAAYWD